MSVLRFDLNTTGRDFVVGDIHGCFDKLELALQEVGFDAANDRLFSVGDLVDRGPDSLAAVEWLAKPWFFAVRGNHEQMAINYADGHNHAFHYERNGGRWFIDLPDEQQQEIAAIFKLLPFAAQVETPAGTVGIVHAEVPNDNWESLRNPDKHAQEVALWARERYMNDDNSLVKNIDRVYVGHTPMKWPKQLGNVHYIDTGAVFGGRIQLVCITDDYNPDDPIPYEITEAGKALLK